MKLVFFDVDTQLDFLLPAGALYVPGGEQLIPVLIHLLRFAVYHSIQVISTLDTHTEDDPEFRVWKPHCVAGTVGQLKPHGTRVTAASVIPNSLLPAGALRERAMAPQLLIEKQSLDCFTNPNLRQLIEYLNADLYVIYGVVTEICVQQAALGLLALGAGVALVTDAVRTLDQTAAAESFAVLARAGGYLTSVFDATSMTFAANMISRKRKPLPARTTGHKDEAGRIV